MRAKEIVAALNGRNGVCFCPAHENTRTPALSVSEGHDGRLLLHCHAGCSFHEVLNALRQRGLLDGAQASASPSREQLREIREAERRDVEKRAQRALNCWRETVPIKGTPAETYLREVRQITAPILDSLRYHPQCWHGPTAGRLPAMVALVDGVKLPAIHRTYLMPDGSGKAQVEPNRMMLGGCIGGHVEVAQAEGPLVIAEGIETALALASGLLPQPATIWATLSTSGMTNVILPEWVHRLTIATDSDDGGAGLQAGKALAERAKAKGWRGAILPAPNGTDWNDVLMLKRRRAA